MTAAHCAGVFVENGIFLGGNTADGAGSLYFGVTKEFPHPGYGTLCFHINCFMKLYISANVLSLNNFLLAIPIDTVSDLNGE